METADVYFAWLFRDKAEPFYTNSPVVEAAFNLPGFYTVSVNLTSRGNVFYVFFSLFRSLVKKVVFHTAWRQVSCFILHSCFIQFH